MLRFGCRYKSSGCGGSFQRERACQQPVVAAVAQLLRDQRGGAVQEHAELGLAAPQALLEPRRRRRRAARGARHPRPRQGGPSPGHARRSRACCGAPDKHHTGLVASRSASPGPPMRHRSGAVSKLRGTSRCFRIRTAPATTEIRPAPTIAWAMPKHWGAGARGREVALRAEGQVGHRRRPRPRRAPVAHRSQRQVRLGFYIQQEFFVFDSLRLPRSGGLYDEREKERQTLRPWHQR